MSSLSVGKKNKTGDNWYTPKSAFEDIAHLIPKDKVIFECFYGDGSSGKYLTELGFTVEHHDIDFFEPTPFDYDIIVSNPPFSKKIAIFKHLAKLDKPFILLVPVSILTKQYLKKYFKDKVQIIIPKSRIHFLKNGQAGTGCWFDTIFICYKINLQRDITFL
tara:strand:+ start:1995 stop:2480 length:486 start_codon:yes stop_codon:yes gene_type:complete